MPLEQYSRARIARLLHAPEHYDGWNANRRAPQVGDVGTVVEVLRAPGLPVVYVVECIGLHGVTEWLGDFYVEDIEPMEP